MVSGSAISLWCSSEFPLTSATKVEYLHSDSDLIVRVHGAGAIFIVLCAEPSSAAVGSQS